MIEEQYRKLRCRKEFPHITWSDLMYTVLLVWIEYHRTS